MKHPPPRHGQDSSPSPVLDIRDLNYRYPGTDHPALAGVNLSVAPGERVGLIGPNGAGKSTLLLHINGILATSAQVRVGGLPATRPNLARIRNMVGLVFQDGNDQLFMPTVFDDIAFGPLNQGLPPDLVRARVAEALESVGMQGFEDHSPHHLSGGERRRVAMATVLSMRPLLLILDEPTSNLDARGRARLVATLRRQPTAVLVATHDLGLVRAICTRCVVMDHGSVVAQGPVGTILDDRHLLERHGLWASLD